MLFATELYVDGGSPVGIGTAPMLAVGMFVQGPDTQGTMQRWEVTAIDWYRNEIGAWVQLLRATADGASAAVPGPMA